MVSVPVGAHANALWFRILAFNSSFEDLCQKQRQWRVPDQKPLPHSSS